MFLEIQKIVKSYGQEHVVKDLNFTLDSGHTLSILGKSGCGKTTMLKTIGGLVKPDSGEIYLKKENITRKKPENRNIVYLYQEDLLFPHLDTFENIAFGLRLKKTPNAEIKEKVSKMLHSLELEEQAHKMPHQLSGGQRQRVSFGRAIIINPSLLLLDEPFGSLDSGTRKRMQAFFKKLTREFNITSLFVTHDLKEAVLMGDQIGYMHEGRLRVYRDKQEFINDPATGVQSEVEFWESLKTEDKKELIK